MISALGFRRSQRGEGVFGATSWSADGRWLAGSMTRRDRSPQPGIVIYELATGRFRRLTGRGTAPAWLHGVPALLYPDEGRILVYDLRTQRAQEVLAAPHQSTFRFAGASRDDRRLFLVRRVEDGDVWMLTRD